jgi:hypothetical protein
VGLAFQASGARDYQAARLLIKSSDRLPALVHYPARYQPDTPNRIQLHVQGDSFTRYVQGKLVDYWSDARLGAGAPVCSA